MLFCSFHVFSVPGFPSGVSQKLPERSNEMIGPRVRCRHPVLAGDAVHLMALFGLPLGSAAGGLQGSFNNDDEIDPTAPS